MLRRRNGRRTRRRPRRNIRRPRRSIRSRKGGSLRLYRFARHTTNPSVFNITTSAGCVATYGTSGLLNITTPAAAGSNYVSFALVHTIADVSGAAEFSALFDQYRLNSVKVTAMPISGNDPGTFTGTSASGIGAILHHVYDFDDAVTFAASSVGIESMKESHYYKCLNFAQLRRFNKFYRPRTLVLTDTAGAGTMAALAPRKTWMDFAVTGVRYYGSKYILELYQTTAVASIYALRFDFTYGFQCMGLR